MYEQKRTRSRFWLRIYDNDTSISLSANYLTSKLIQLKFPQLEANSPKGWTESTNISDLYNLWLPNDCYEPQDIEELKEWAENINKYIWLSTNKNTAPFFNGEELDFCLAYDWGFNFDTNKRTPVGEAEYWLKYHPERLFDEQRDAYVQTMAQAVRECVSAIPIHFEDFVVTTVPATQSKQQKLSWSLAKYVSRGLKLPFVALTLTRDKPEMKSLSLAEKVNTWRKIYSDESWISVPENLCGKNVLIVDDLFQSGTSLFCFAEFLKHKLGTKQVIAVTSVKSQRDGDNK